METTGGEPAFTDLVRDALVHLYDEPALQRHPLAVHVGHAEYAGNGIGLAGAGAGPETAGRARPPSPPSSAAVSGRALQRELLAAVESLRPVRTAATGPASRAARRHQLLALRYVEALPVATTQAQLAISRAEYFRAHRRALEAVAGALQARWGLAAAANGPVDGQPDRQVEGQIDGRFDRRFDRHFDGHFDGAVVGSAQAPGQEAREWRGADQVAPQLTSFVGRERELAEARRLLHAGRLLTLTGPGGTGKTRLALRLAEQTAGRFADGVVLVPLAALTDPGLVLQAIARAVGVPESENRPVLEALLAALRSRQLLLVLDTFERLPAAAPLVPDLLAACPGLTVLVTSRAPLRVAGEQVFPVPPLALPPLALPDPGSAAASAIGASADAATDPDLPALAGSEAVRLFVERARSVRPGFALTRENTRAVAEVCRRLDGLPLALELAAARVRALGVADLTARLDDRFRLLTGGSRAAPPHQQTLRATVDWSHALLSEAERTAFRRLSVFSGGWTLEAAEAVCADAIGDAIASSDAADTSAGISRAATAESEGPDVGASESDVAPGQVERTSAIIRRDDVLDLLTGLADQSLVEADARQEDGGGLRYRLLDTLRAYARERLLEAGEITAVRDRHLAWCTDLAERASRGCEGPQEAEWLDRLETDVDNARAALAWSLEGGRVVAGLRFVGALSSTCFWSLRGSRVEGRHWLETLLAAGPTEEDPAAGAGPPERARALLGAGEQAFFLGDHACAHTRFEQGVTLYRGLGDQAGLAIGLADMAAYLRGEPVERRRDWAAEGLALARAAGDDAILARALLATGSIALDAGDLPAAAAYLEESLGRFRSVGQPLRISAAQGILANVALARGDLPRAEALYAERLALSRQLRDPGATGGALLGLATVARRRGDHARALALYQESLAFYIKVGQPGAAIACLEGVAWALAAQGHDEQAARLLGAAGAVPSASGGPVPPVDRATLEREVAAVRARLGEAAFATAWAAGEVMTLDQATAEALA